MIKQITQQTFDNWYEKHLDCPESLKRPPKWNNKKDQVVYKNGKGKTIGWLQLSRGSTEWWLEESLYKSLNY